MERVPKALLCVIKVLLRIAAALGGFYVGMIVSLLLEKFLIQIIFPCTPGEVCMKGMYIGPILFFILLPIVSITFAVFGYRLAAHGWRPLAAIFGNAVSSTSFGLRYWFWFIVSAIKRER